MGWLGPLGHPQARSEVSRFTPGQDFRSGGSGPGITPCAQSQVGRFVPTAGFRTEGTKQSAQSWRGPVSPGVGSQVAGLGSGGPGPSASQEVGARWIGLSLE